MNHCGTASGANTAVTSRWPSTRLGAVSLSSHSSGGISQGYPMHIRRFIPVLLCAMPLLCGCLMVPIPTSERKVLAGKPVPPEQLAFLVPNVTTKTEVTDQLGSPNVIWEDAHVFAYHWVVRRGVVLLFGDVTDAGDYPGTDFVVGVSSDIPKRYVLLIQFDEQDRLRRFERAVHPAFQWYGDFLKERVGNFDKASPKPE